MISVSYTTNGSVRFSKYSSYKNNPKHFTHSLELNANGEITLTFSDPYEKVFSKLKTLTPEEKVSKIYEWLKDQITGE